MWCKLIATVLFAVVVQHVLRFIIQIHTFQNVFNHGPGPCRRLPSAANGSEDGYVLPNGLAYLTSGFGRRAGKFLRFDFESDVNDVEEFRMEGDIDFSSLSLHGIGLWDDPKTDEVTIFAVNHHKDGERVEVFRHDGSKASRVLKHLRTITDPNITFLNDIVATGPDTFYATRFFGLSMALDYLLMYHGGAVLLYDKGKTRVLETGLLMANGINISPDKKYLYVVEGGNGRIITYNIKADKSIERTHVYNTNSGPDNINVDAQTGDLWVGCHPNAYITALHLSYPEEDYLSYSQVLRMKVENGKISDVREVYANDGSEIRGSSVALTYKKKLLIGTVIDGAVICDLVYPGDSYTPPFLRSPVP